MNSLKCVTVTLSQKNLSVSPVFTLCHHAHNTSDTEHVGFFPPTMQFSASLVAQLVKNPLEMQETPVQLLGWEDPLEKG